MQWHKQTQYWRCFVKISDAPDKPLLSTLNIDVQAVFDKNWKLATILPGNQPKTNVQHS